MTLLSVSSASQKLMSRAMRSRPSAQGGRVWALLPQFFNSTCVMGLLYTSRNTARLLVYLSPATAGRSAFASRSCGCFGSGLVTRHLCAYQCLVASLPQFVSQLVAPGVVWCE